MTDASKDTLSSGGAQSDRFEFVLQVAGIATYGPLPHEQNAQIERLANQESGFKVSSERTRLTFERLLGERRVLGRIEAKLPIQFNHPCHAFLESGTLVAAVNGSILRPAWESVNVRDWHDTGVPVDVNLTMKRNKIGGTFSYCSSNRNLPMIPQHYYLLGGSGGSKCYLYSFARLLPADAHPDLCKLAKAVDDRQRTLMQAETARQDSAKKPAE